MTAQLLLFPDETERNTPVTPDAAQQLIDLGCQLSSRKHHVEAALAYAEGTHTFDDVVHMVLAGRLHWIPLPDSFMIMEIVTYPRQKHLHGFLAGGKLEEITACQDQLVELARSLGCCAITLSGRRGWVKALKPLGWTESHTTVCFPVTLNEGQDHG